MSVTVSLSDIEKGYNSLINSNLSNNQQTTGETNTPNFYYARKVFWLYAYLQARAGTVYYQDLMSGMPLQAVEYPAGPNITIDYNSEGFDFVAGDINVMTPNEAELLIANAAANDITLSKVALSTFFSSGKSNFYYW